MEFISLTIQTQNHKSNRIRSACDFSIWWIDIVNSMQCQALHVFVVMQSEIELSVTKKRRAHTTRTHKNAKNVNGYERRERERKANKTPTKTHHTHTQMNNQYSSISCWIFFSSSLNIAVELTYYAYKSDENGQNGAYDIEMKLKIKLNVILDKVWSVQCNGDGLTIMLTVCLFVRMSIWWTWNTFITLNI